MTAKHIMDSASRRKKVYIDLHKKLRAECQPFTKSYSVTPSEPSKSERKRAASEQFRSHGE